MASSLSSPRWAECTSATLSLKRPLKKSSDSMKARSRLASVGVLRHDQNERHDLRRAGHAVIAVKLHGDVIVVMDGVFELDLLKLVLAAPSVGSKSLRVATAGSFTKPSAMAWPRCSCRSRCGTARERAPTVFGVAVSSKPKDRLQAVDGVRPGAGAVAVRLVHQQDEVVSLER